MASEFRESERGPATAVAPLAIASTTLSYSVRQRIFLYLGILIVLLAYGAPSGGLIDIPISFFLKNKLHLKAHEVAEFRLVAAIPLYRRAPSKSVRAEGLREHHSRSLVRLAVLLRGGVMGDASQGGAQHAHRICYASCRSSQPMVVAAIGVAAMSADARSQLREYRNQPVMAPRTNHSGIERTTKNTTHAPS
jgi:hypothetical protein